MAFFVYVKFNGRICPQRFDEWPYVDGKPLEVLQQHEVNKLEMHSRISFLVKKYPYKGPEDLT